MYQGARRRPAPDAMRPRKRDKAPKGRPARVLCETCSRRRALAKRALPEAAPRRVRGGRRRLAARASAFPRPPFKGCRMGKKWLVPKLALLNYLHGGEGLRSA